MTAPFRPAPNGQQGFPGQQQQQPGQQQFQQQPVPQQPPQAQVPFTQNILPDPAWQMPAPQFPPPQQPGQPMPDPYRPQQPQYQQQPQAQPQQYAPAWQGGQPIPQQQPQFPGQQQQPAPQQQQRQAPAQAIQFDQQGRMFGPGLPQELQGKTMQEAVGLFGVMRNYVAQTQAGQRQQQQPAPQTQPTQGQQQPNRQPAADFFNNPEAAIQRVVERTLAPVLEQSHEQAITQARNSVAQLHPQQFAAYEGEVYQRLQGLPAETLANPAAWRLALQQVVGEKAMQGQPVPQPQQQQNGQPFQQQQYGQQAQPSQQNLPWQPASAPSFFTESPSAFMQGGAQPGQPGMPTMQLSAAQQEVARRMGLTNEQYIQGMGARY